MTARSTLPCLCAVFLWTLITICLCFASPAHANHALDAWRKEVGRVRKLAENDAPSAFSALLGLKSTLPVDVLPTDRVRLLNLRSRIEAYLTQLTEADDHAHEAIALAKQHGDKIGQAEANINIALNGITTGRIDKVRQAAIAAVKLLDGANRPELLAEAMLRTSAMYLRHGQYSAAVSIAMQSLEIAKHSENRLALTYAHQAMGMVLDLSGMSREANEHYTQMRELSQAEESALLEVFALAGMAGTVAKLGNPYGAEGIQRQAIALAEKIGAPYSVSHTIFGLSQLKRQQGQLASALVLLNETLTIYHHYPNSIGEWWVRDARVGDLLALGRINEAAAEAVEVDALAKKIGFPFYFAESGKRMAAIAMARGQYKQAYEFQVEAEAMAHKAEQKKVGELIIDITDRYQTEARQRQIDDLTRREAERVREFTLLWTVLGASLATLSVTIYFTLRLRRSRGQIRTLNAGLEQRVRERTDELRQQARYLRTLIDTLPVRVWMKDVQGRYLTINNPEEAINGRNGAAIIGKTDLELWPGAVGKDHRAADLTVIKTRRPMSREAIWHDDSNRRKVWMEIDKAPVIDEDGSLLGTVSVARDISERRIVEKMREAALADAQRLARLRGDFLTHMSHELRTPLNGILGHTQILQKDPTLGTHQCATAGVIRASGEHLKTLIDDVLEFARIEAGKLELIPEHISLSELLQLVREIVVVKARQKDIHFSSILSLNLPAHVCIDGKRLRQVLLNLLSNAIKFTERGQVSLWVEAPTSGRLRFEIRDTGCGIAEDQLSKIFLPFEQAGDVKQQRRGTGLGLAISQQIVLLMGGEITVESRLGEGSRFLFEIDALPLNIPCEDPSPQATTMNIMLVAPPPKEMAILHRLALFGNMRDVVQQADKINALDPTYQPFAARLKELAGSYQSKTLLTFVQRYHQRSDV